MMLLYKGEWVQDTDTYHFEGSEGKGIMVKKNTSYHELLRAVYHILQLDSMECSISMKYAFNGNCDAPNSAPGVKQGCHFFPVYYKLIIFKFVHSYNVNHLTYTIFCSRGLQNIYKLHIWKYSTFTIFTLFTKETKTHIH